MACDLSLLLTVERAFALETTGVVVVPDAPAAAATFPSSRMAAGELRYPNGRARSIELTLQWTHFDEGGYRLMCIILDAPLAEVVAGCEVWCATHDRASGA